MPVDLNGIYQLNCFAVSAVPSLSNYTKVNNNTDGINSHTLMIAEFCVGRKC